MAVMVYRVGVIGCGLIGRRRADTAAAHPNTVVAAVVDADLARAESLAESIAVMQAGAEAVVAAGRATAENATFGTAASGKVDSGRVDSGNASSAKASAAKTGVAAFRDWRRVVEDPAIDAVVVATPNGYLAEIGRAALAAGKHLLLEKPMGRNLAEAEWLAAGVAGATDGTGGAGGAGGTGGAGAAAAVDSVARVGGIAGPVLPILKVGFNHRYHPAVAELLATIHSGGIGRVIGIRARYGHGGRPGYEREWRGDSALAGGGHLIDQGVHLADLIHGVAGLPARGVAFLQTAVWPLAPLEDNAYGTFHFEDGVVAQFHVSMTQWKNLFSFEVHGEAGAVAVEGLGGSYGEERLVRTRRRREGGVPEVVEESFPGPDRSWTLEWEDFVEALGSGRLQHGGVADGLAAMRMIDALYRSAASGLIEEV